MAKSKKTVALFEVLHRDPKGISLKTPPWWYKNRSVVNAPIQKTIPRKPDEPAPPTVSREACAAKPPATQAVADLPASEARVVGPVISPVTVAAPEPMPLPAAPEIAPSRADPTLGHSPEDNDPPAEGRSAWLDEMRRNLTPTSIAMIVSFAAVLLIATFIVGRLRNKSYSYAAVTTDALRQQPPRPDVLNVRKVTDSNGGAATPANLGGSSARTSIPSHSDVNSSKPFNVVDPNASAPGADNAPATAKRQIGLNYVLAQSYPTEAMANTAAQFLSGRGVGCTVEYGISGWPHSYCVIGTDGFTGPGSPDCREMVQKIRALTPDSRKFTAFDPLVVKWVMTDR